MIKIKKVHIFGGGTVQYIANHLAISAPAYGGTARILHELVQKRFNTCHSYLELTKMAGHCSGMETNEDVEDRVDNLLGDFNTKVIFFTCALCDYTPASVQSARVTDDSLDTTQLCLGKYANRINSRDNPDVTLNIKKANKVISRIRKTRKDIFLVGFKTTCGATKLEMYAKGLALCKEASCNLVLVNDAKTRWNMIITPEEAVYHETQDRLDVLTQLVDMAYFRSHLSFTQSTVLDGQPVAWKDPRVPESLRKVVDYCISKNAYKPFKNATVGHFAVKLSDTEFLTSMRKSNFNDLDQTGLVYVRTDGPDTVLAYGAKPSVGGQSQRIVFNDHPGMDCIVHFHCPILPGNACGIPIRSQREVECGSHQCGMQTSSGLKQFGNLKAVYLDNHGPNIVFNKNINAQEVIDFINTNFNLSDKTGGYVL